MIVKIFYPKSLFYEKKECSLYGEVAIEENSISYFIISSHKEAGYRRLGCSSEAGNEISCDVSLKFAFDDNYPHVYLINLSVKTSGNAENVIILYEPENLFKLHSSENVAIEDTNDIDLLKVLLERHSETSVKTIGSTVLGVFGNFYQIFCKMRQFIIAYICSLFRHTKLNDFFVGWKSCLDSEDVPEKQRGKVAFDVITGVLVMAWVFFNEPGKYAPNISKNIILQMRTLIQSLKGNPIGLKLNAQLNNFFLDCSTYHMDLWATFIEIIGPSIFYFIFPIGVLGILGLSFQLAILSDLIILLSLHAQSFFVFASVLYNLEKVGLSALWKVVLGRRKNVLKGRAESHDYMNRQLYLATIFFTTLLFLLPTVFVYYVVFATLRIAIFLINYILIKLQKKLLQFPIDHLMKWMCGCYYDIGDIEVEYVTSVTNEIGPTTSIFQLHIMKSSPLKNSIIRPSNNLPKNTIKLFDAVKAAVNGKLINFV